MRRKWSHVNAVSTSFCRTAQSLVTSITPDYRLVRSMWRSTQVLHGPFVQLGRNKAIVLKNKETPLSRKYTFGTHLVVTIEPNPRSYLPTSYPVCGDSHKRRMMRCGECDWARGHDDDRQPDEVTFIMFNLTKAQQSKMRATKLNELCSRWRENGLSSNVKRRQGKDLCTWSRASSTIFDYQLLFCAH